MQDCVVGEAGLRKQAQREETTIRFDQLISSDGVRRQMINFAYNQGLGPVLEASNHTLGLTMQPLTATTNQTSLSVPQPSNNNLLYHATPPPPPPATRTQNTQVTTDR